MIPILVPYGARSRWIVTIGFVALTTTACSRDRRLLASQRVATATGAVRVDPRPVADFGSDGPTTEGEFSHVTAGTRLSTGQLVIVDPRLKRVVYFDSSGHPIRTVTGAAPGAAGFKAPVWIGRCSGDSVLVWDALADSLALFDAAGRFVRQFGAPKNIAQLRCSADGALVAVGAPRIAHKASLFGLSNRELVPLGVSARYSDSLHTVKFVPFVENRPLGRATFLAINKGELYVGTADSGVVNGYSLDGNHTGTIRVSSDSTPAPTASEYSAAIDEIVGGLGSKSDRDHARAYFERIPRPNAVPPYSGIFASPNGTVWADVSVPGDSEAVLHSFSSSGQSLGEVRLPADVTILEIGTDYILGAYKAGDDLERIVVYRIKLPSRLDARAATLVAQRQ